MKKTFSMYGLHKWTDKVILILYLWCFEKDKVHLIPAFVIKYDCLELEILFNYKVLTR